VAWEQPVHLGAGLTTAPGPDGALLGFEEEIPPSVNAIRFVLTPPSGGKCCVAVVRGSQAFEDRHIVLQGAQAGENFLEVNGYPTDFAPSDGISQTCPSDGGTSCSSERTLPSFASGDVFVDVEANTTNIVDVDVHSVPFLLDLFPDDGDTAEDVRPHVSFKIVDANFGIDDDFTAEITQGLLSTGVAFDDIKDCADGDSQLPDCSPGGELEVRGVSVSGQAEEALNPGQADLHIEASNTAPTQRTMESDTTFLVPEGTTTTSTSSTVPSSTTSTTEPEPPVTFCVDFTVDSNVDLLGVSYTVDYSATGGDFEGTGENVECFSLIDEGETTLTSFNDDEGTSQLNSAVISAQTFTVPQAIAECFFTVVPPLNLQAFDIQVTEATAGDLSPATATVTISETTCPH
jgi:hypothetical protein